MAAVAAADPHCLDVLRSLLGRYQLESKLVSGVSEYTISSHVLHAVDFGEWICEVETELNSVLVTITASPDADAKAALTREARRLANVCKRFLYNMDIAKRAMMGVFGMAADGSPGETHLASNYSYLEYHDIDEVTAGRSFTKFHDTLMYIQFCFRTSNLRRYHEDVYEAVRNAGGGRTVAWRRTGSIRDMVYEFCSIYRRPESWAVVSDNLNVQKIVAYFTDSRDFCLPEMKRDKHLFAFSDAAFDTLDGRVYFYDDVPADHPLWARAACRQFAEAFPRDLHRVDGQYEHWRDIPTPAFDRIFTHQNLHLEDTSLPQGDLRRDSVLSWLFRLIGRMYHDVGESDDFQVLLYFLGRAGNGKSTAIEHIVSVFDPIDVGEVGNDIEPVFGLWQHAKKLILKALELKGTFRLPSTTLQKMISGEDTTVAKKMLLAETVKWKSHMVAGGNELPGFPCKGGAKKRRLAIVHMPERVTHEDANLKKELGQQLVAFVVKATFAYLELVVTLDRRSGIWEMLPKHFVDNQDIIDENSFAQFMKSETMECDNGVARRHIGEDGQKRTRRFDMPWVEFKEEYRNWCRDNGVPATVSLSKKSEYEYLLEDYRLELCQPRGAAKRVVGVRVRPPFLMMAAEEEEEEEYDPRGQSDGDSQSHMHQGSQPQPSARAAKRNADTSTSAAAAAAENQRNKRRSRH
jgi:hypothetical protein